MLTANMKMIAECADKLVHLGEKLFNETEMKTFKIGQTTEFSCPDGYEFKDENGNVIQAKKIVLEKKLEIPKSPRACAMVLGIKEPNEYKKQESDLLRLLILYRDACWKLAGDWSPKPQDTHYAITHCQFSSEIFKISYCATEGYPLLVFPTAKMRDEFYEKFKGIIEECKELL